MRLTRALALPAAALAFAGCADPVAPAPITSSISSSTVATSENTSIANFSVSNGTLTVTRTFQGGMGCGATFTVEPEVRFPAMSILVTTTNEGSACAAGQSGQYTVTINNVPAGDYAPVRLSEKPSVDGEANLVVLTRVFVRAGSTN